MAVLRKLHTYRGDSRFTTWAYKFALLEAAAAMRRRPWHGRELPLEADGWARFPDGGTSPAGQAEASELIDAIRDAIAEVLTPHQRGVLVALTLNDVPIDVLAERRGTTRNALYKTLHDGRRKLRAGWQRTDSNPPARRKSTRHASANGQWDKRAREPGLRPKMLDFTLTEQQRNIRELAHDFAEKEIRPVAWEYDRDATWPEQIIKKAWDVGLMNSQLPEKYGGAGASYVDGVLIGEELAWGCAAIGTTLGTNELAATPVLLGGSEKIKAEYLGMLTEEPKLASFCLTEPDAGSDVSAMRTTAVRRGDKYVINGSKVFISNGGYADWYTVYAKTDKDAGHRGISAFVVPRDDTVTVDKHEDKMGLRASNTAAISFNETEVPAENLLGDENHGFKLAMMTLDRTRPGVAAMATGIARAAFEFATEYSKQRVQFGVPIAMHQAIQFMIADMATEIEAARLLTWQSAVLLDQGKRNTLQSSHAKRFAADTAMKVATDAVQIYGGYGFIKDYPVEKLMRDAKIMQLYEGTSQIQRLVIAREILLPRQVEEPAVERQLAAA